MIINQKGIKQTSIFLLIISFCLSGHLVHADTPSNLYSPQEQKVDFSTNKPLASIPFTFDGRIPIPVQINGSDNVDIILDSGFPQKTMMLLTHNELGEQLGLEYAQTLNLARGGGSGPLKAVHIAPEVDVSLSKINLGKMTVGVLDESQDTSVFHNKGVFGGAIFLSYIVKIDFDNSLLTLFDSASYIPEEGWEEIPLDLSNRNLPMIETIIYTKDSKEIEGKFLLDTGGEGAMILRLNDEKQIKKPKKTAYTLVGTGLRGDAFADLGRISGLSIGAYQIKNVISSFFSEDEIKNTLPALLELECDGVIGISHLYRFNMIFDYAHNRMFIKPNKYFNDKFEMNMAGMTIKKIGTGVHLVYHVMKNSPASKQGLRKGDTIEKVNGKNIDLFDYLELKKIFEQKGKNITIKIQRNGKKQTVKLRLKRII